jgi:hypothetical protein
MLRFRTKIMGNNSTSKEMALLGKCLVSTNILKSLFETKWPHLPLSIKYCNLDSIIM